MKKSKLILRIALNLFCASAQAQENLPNGNKSTLSQLNTEFYFGVPMHINQVTTLNGSAQSTSTSGIHLTYRVCNSTIVCPHANYTASIDPRTGRRPLSGPSLGLHTFVLGGPDVGDNQAGLSSSSSAADIFRIYTVTDVCQRDFDFRTRTSIDAVEDVLLATRVDGSTWAYALGAGVEYAPAGWGRFGLEMTRLKSQTTSVQNFQIQSLVFLLSYQIR